jgi:hypothetical protein
MSEEQKAGYLIGFGIGVLLGFTFQVCYLMKITQYELMGVCVVAIAIIGCWHKK